MKKSLLLLFSLFVIFNISAQDSSIELKKLPALDSFDLSKYVLPELEFKALNVRANYNMDNANRYVFRDSKQDFGMRSAVNLHSYCYKNKPRFQSIGRAFFNAEYSFSKNKVRFSSKDFNANRTELRFDFTRDMRFYYKSKRFFGIDIRLNTQFNDWDYSASISGIRGLKYLYFNLSTGLNIGVGRIEDVTDAWNTIYLLKDFSRLSILDHNPTDTEIIEVATKISQIKNKRIFDYRLRKIAEIKAVDEVLNSNNLINQRDVDYFTSLNDMYFYSHNIRRYAGTRYTAGLIPIYSIFNNILDDNTSNYYGLGLNLKYDRYKPINMFWQFDTQLSLGMFYISNSPYKNLEKRNNTLDLKPTVTLSLKYIPSTRTIISTELHMFYVMNYYELSIYHIDDNTFVSYWANSINYYFSPRLSANARLTLYYGAGDLYHIGIPDQFISYPFSSLYFDKGLGYNMQIRFNYSIF